MASLQWRNGKSGELAVIQFYDDRGRHRSLSLGGVSRRVGVELFSRVQALLESKHTGEPLDARTSAWLRGIGPGLREQLEDFGLIAPDGARVTLGTFLQGFVDSRGDVKPATKLVYGHTKRCLLDYFGEGRAISTITTGDMDDWRLWLLSTDEAKHGQGLGENTVRRRSGIARQFFNAAVRKKLIPENPAAGLSVKVRGSVKKRFFVPVEMAQAILDKCPDAEWRALFALARWGGLRIPSEALALTWEDVKWDAGKLRVPSCKTEHHEGGEERTIPLFPELRIPLEDAFAKRETASKHVISRYRSPNQNLRTQLARIIRQTGMTPWPKLWVNLRATRATEIFTAYPRHVGEAWMGHCFSTATEHYLSVPADQFKLATEAKCAIRVLSGDSRRFTECHEPALGLQEPQLEATEDGEKDVNWALQDSNL